MYGVIFLRSELDTANVLGTKLAYDMNGLQGIPYNSGVITIFTREGSQVQSMSRPPLKSITYILTTERPACAVAHARTPRFCLTRHG